MKKKEILSLINTLVLFHKVILFIDIDEWHICFEDKKYYFFIVLLLEKTAK